MALGSFAQTVTWSDSFVQAAAPTTEQCLNWENFLSQLDQKTFATVTISGSNDPVGISISDPAAATQLAQLLSSKTPGSVTSGGHTWTVANDCGISACNTGLAITLTVDPAYSYCNCNENYSIKPQSSGNQWGGINSGVSCGAPSQSMQLVFHSGVTVTAEGPTTFCPGENVILTANAELCAGPYNYLWSTGETTPSIVASEAGSYFVTATSSDGCAATSSAITVSHLPISVDAGVAEPFCDAPVQLNATGTPDLGGVVNQFCLFDARSSRGCTIPLNHDVCTSSFFYLTGSFSQAVSLSNPTELRYKIYYSAFSASTFILKLNNQEIGSYAETVVTGACNTTGEGKFPRTFTFTADQFLQHWNEGGDNILTVEITSNAPAGARGILLAAISAEVVTSNSSYVWSPAEGLSNPSIRNPLASPSATTVYTVTYTAANGCIATDQVEVALCNPAPVAVCQPVVIPAGGACEAIVEATAFDGGSTSSTGGELSYSVSPAGPYPVGETQVTFTVTDQSNNETSSCTTTVTVNDTTLPVLVTSGDLVVANDAGSCSATVTLGQPESSDNCGVQTVTHDQGDDIFPVGETIVTWTVTDIHGNEATATQKVTVTNSVPVVSAVTASATMVEINSPVSLMVSFADNNIARASIEWGDLSAPEIVESPEDNFSVSHAYTVAGTYAVTVTLTDLCDESVSYIYESITVYEKRAGYVKGGGWYYSTPGYYLNNDRAAGKAQFEFEAQYTDSGDLLGQAKFKFKAGKLRFASTDYALLVIDRNSAFLTGTGTVNGIGGYGILIAMVDDDKKNTNSFESSYARGKKGKSQMTKADRIRVKISDPNGSVIYDTQPGSPDDETATANLGGGNIVINSSSSAFGEETEGLMASNFGEESGYSVYPNPFIDWIQVQFNSFSQEDVTVQLMDLAGKVIYAAQFDASEDGTYSLEIPENEKGPGIYILKIKQGRRVEFIRVVRH